MRQLYGQGLTMLLIAKRFRITHQAVSKMLDRKNNTRLQKQHVERRDLNKKLRAGGASRRRMRSRVRELRAQGLSLEFVADQLALLQQDVTEMIEGDAEIKRRHATRVALDRKLIVGEPVTEADVSVHQAASLPDDRRRRAVSGDDRGESTPSRKKSAVEEDAESTTDGHSESETTGQRKTQPRKAVESATKNATTEQPKTQPPPSASDSATDADHSKAQPREATKSTTVHLQALRERQRIEERAAAVVQLVIKHVDAAYGYRPAQFSQESTPQLRWQSTGQQQLEEARQVAMFIALGITGLSAVQLARISDWSLSTIVYAEREITAIYCVDETRRTMILSTTSQIREEAGLKYTETVVSSAQPRMIDSQHRGAGAR